MYPIETKLAPKNSWFTPTESNNYYKARYSREGVTVHWWGGGQGANQHDSIVNYFMQQGAAGVKSVNYVVSDGKITMMVDPDNVAWCSQTGNPTTISIEFQPTLSDEGYKRGGWLIASLEKKYGHKMNLYPHSKWFSTACPGSIDINRLRKEADAASGGAIKPAPAPAPSAPAQPSGNGVAVAVRPANVRVAPNTSAAIGGSKLLNVGESFIYVAKVRGENVSQNGVTTDIWFKSQFGNYVWAGNLNDRSNGAVPIAKPSANKGGGTATVTGTANVRIAPNTRAALGGSQVLYKGETFVYTEKVVGESVSGNNIWYHSAKGNYVWSGNVKG